MDHLIQRRTDELVLKIIAMFERLDVNIADSSTLKTDGGLVQYDMSTMFKIMDSSRLRSIFRILSSNRTWYCSTSLNSRVGRSVTICND